MTCPLRNYSYIYHRGISGTELATKEQRPLKENKKKTEPSLYVKSHPCQRDKTFLFKEKCKIITVESKAFYSVIYKVIYMTNDI